jgi:hypothetical protein
MSDGETNMITATYDLTGKSWTIDGEGTEFAVAFTDGDAEAIHPDRLRFGWLITVNGEQQDEETFPAENVTYVEIKPTARFHGRVQALPEDDVSIVFNAATGDDAMTSAEQKFTVPRPPQPYPSWTWEDGVWTAPVPYPDDDAPYVWDEETQDWIPYTEETEDA